MRFLNFIVSEEEYGVPLEQVREVIAFPEITAMPDSPKHCLGIMSLREEIIPIVDLRIRFNIEPTLTHDTAVIICELGELKYGAVVDSINTVVSLDDKEVMKIPLKSAGEGGAGSELTSSAVRLGKKLIVILDMSKLLDASEQAILRARNREAA